MEHSEFELARPWQTRLVAVVCALFSLPWYYILTVAIYTMVRNSDPPTSEVIWVLAAVAAVASFCTYLAYRLARGAQAGRNLLSVGFLWCWAAVSTCMAVFGLTAHPPLVGAAIRFGGFAAAAAALAVARARGSRR